MYSLQNKSLTINKQMPHQCTRKLILTVMNIFYLLSIEVNYFFEDSFAKTLYEWRSAVQSDITVYQIFLVSSYTTLPSRPSNFLIIRIIQLLINKLYYTMNNVSLNYLISCDLKWYNYNVEYIVVMPLCLKGLHMINYAIWYQD